MAKYAIGYGIVLILLGVGGYFATGMASLTALIPAAFGLVLLLLGLLGHAKEDLNKHAMHAALLVALLGFAATARSFPQVLSMFQGDEAALARRPAIISQALMAVITLAFIVQGIRSFIEARRRRKSAGAG